MITATDPLISVIIVSYNSQEELPACLESVHRQPTPCEVFVVDNASTDASCAVVGDYRSRWPGITLLANRANRGLAAANNQPLPACRGAYVLILNPDTILDTTTLPTLVAYLETHPDVGTVGPRCYFEDGSSHTSYHYGWTLGHVLLWRVVPYRLVRALYDRFARYPEAPVLFVSGACLLMRRELYAAIGGYDERFFLSVEDAADLCLRADQAGFRTVFYPRARITHLTGRSQRGLSYFATALGYNGSIYYLRKHHGAGQGAAIWMILLLAATLKALLTRFVAVLKPDPYQQSSQVYGALARDLHSGRLLRPDAFTGDVPAVSDARLTTPQEG